MTNFLQVQDSSIETSLGLFGFIGRCMGVGGGNTPLRHFIGPLSQNARRFAERRFFSGRFINQTHCDRIAGPVADILDWRASARLHSPGFSPFPHRKNYLAEGLSRVGRFVFMAWWIGLVGPAGQQPFIRQLVQAIRQNVSGNPEGLDQLVEAAQSQQQVAHYQDAPAIAEHRHRCRNWAGAALITFRSGARFCSARLFAGAWVPRLPIRFPHELSLATFVPQVDSADGRLGWNLAK